MPNTGGCGRQQVLPEWGDVLSLNFCFPNQYQNQDPWEWKARFLEAGDDAFRKINVDMIKQHARAQMRTQINIGDEAWIGP